MKKRVLKILQILQEKLFYTYYEEHLQTTGSIKLVLGRADPISDKRQLIFRNFLATMS